VVNTEVMSKIVSDILHPPSEFMGLRTPLNLMRV